MPNILIVTAFYSPSIGGYENDIHELAKRLNVNGYDINILTCNTENASAYEVKDGVTINRVACWNLLNKAYPIPLPSWRLFNTLFKRNKYDAVMTQTRFFIICFIGMLFAKLKKLPLIHVERGAGHSVSSNKLVNMLSQIYDHSLGRFLVKSATLNIGVSQASCDFIKHIGSSNTMVIYNGLSYYKHEIKWLKWLNRKSNIVMFVGRLIYAKGVQDLIKAFNICKVKHQELQLLIVGDGNYRNQLETLALMSLYASDIKFLGRKDSKEVAWLLSTAKVFVNPSYSEGLPTSIIEAASFSLPIIATNVGGTSEIIENKVTGLLIEPCNVNQLVDSIHKLLSDESLATRIGINVEKIVSIKFDWDIITEEYKKIIYEVISENKLS